MNQEDFSDTAWQIEFVKGLITQDPLLFAPFSENLQPKRRRTVRRTVLNFWNTNWGLMIKELQTLEEGSYKHSSTTLFLSELLMNASENDQQC
jgi:hypothetical protein